MKRLQSFFIGSFFLVGATLGAGVFALPYLFLIAGWGVSLFYFVLISFLIIFSHIIYFEVLEKQKERIGLLGLIQKSFGLSVSRFGFFVVVIGLVLTLVIYLLLAPQFVTLLFPGFPHTLTTILFWIFFSAPLFFRLRRLTGVENAATVFMILTLFLIFLLSGSRFDFSSAPLFGSADIFFPFAPILFALTGWTAIEPIVALKRRFFQGNVSSTHRFLRFVIIFGTLFTAFLYLSFVAAILSGSPVVSPDTISGLTHWPFFTQIAIVLLGIFAIFTSYLPIGLEIENALQRDLGRSRSFSVLVVVFLPLFLVFSGLTDFFVVIELAGGVFLTLQYIFILLVGRKMLKMSLLRRSFVDICACVFLLVAIYQVYTFLFL